MRINRNLENWGGQTNFQSRNELRQSDEEKIEVEEEFELFVEYDRKEGERIVLLISYNVRGVPRP
jgi:hypothetical protein